MSVFERKLVRDFLHKTGHFCPIRRTLNAQNTATQMNIQLFLQENKDRFISELFELLRLPSISADPTYSSSVEKTAELVAYHMRNAGISGVEICPTPGFPVVYGEVIRNATGPTVLVYGHYDVQPADPLELWETPPFEPTLRITSIHPNGAIFARGACDDKGQFFMHLKAIEAMMASGSLPCNVKFMIEGEEEIGSANLAWFVERNKEKLACDVILISDTGMLAPGVPSITTGLRGLAYMEIELTGPNRDLHSGLYGGAVANPLNAISALIAQLHDKHGRVSIPGFYDKVADLPSKFRQELGLAPFSLEQYKDALNLPDIKGEDGYSTLERTSIRPTLDVNGLWGGYIGEGAKTVIPSKAYAKISMRLVPHQDPEEIALLFQEYIESHAPQGTTVKVTPHHGGHPYVCPPEHPGYRAAHKAVQQIFGKAPIPVRSGGSIPIVALFEKELGVKSILMGFGYDSDAIHSPNEHYGVDNFTKGIETIPWFYTYYSEEFTQ